MTDFSHAKRFIDMVLDNAERLREAGVTELDFGELRVKLSPLEAKKAPLVDFVIPDKTNLVENALLSEADPLMDPDTYGESGKVPGFYNERRQGPASNDRTRVSDGERSD